MYNKAILLGNVYAYNNLGKIYMDEKKYQKAYDNFIVAADLGESWACNQIGEFYRKGILRNKDLKKAFDYYTLSAESPIHNLCPWSKYNLAKYFYENGNIEIGIEKNINKAIELLDDVSNTLICACEELVYIFYNLYIESNKKERLYLEKLNFYKAKCENNAEFDNNLKNKIERNLKKLNNTYITIPELY